MAPAPASILPARLLVASDSVAFAVIFGIFVAALLVMIVIVLRWAVRRDRTGRAQWRQRQTGRASPPDGDAPPPPR
jgi:hypothetical protein